jgi:hypothetical protein
VSETNAGASFASGFKPCGKEKKCTLSYRQGNACYAVRRYGVRNLSGTAGKGQSLKRVTICTTYRYFVR